MRNHLKTLLALILCLAMVSALIPAAAAAEDAKVPVAAGNRDVPDRREAAKPEGKTGEREPGARTVVDDAVYEGTNLFTVETGGDVVYRPFVPEASGNYQIYSSSDSDTFGYLAAKDLTTLTSDDDSGNNLNFKIVYELTAGEVYYIGASFYSGSTTGEIPVTVEPEQRVCGDHLEWDLDLDTGTLIITGYGDMWDFDIGKAPWASYNDRIQNVSLPDGLTNIGAFAFIDATLLESVNLPDGVTGIGYGAFARCDTLYTVTVPASLQFIDDYAFFYSAIDSFYISDAVTYIGPCAFISCLLMEPDAFVVDPNNSNYQVKDGVLYTKDGTSLLMYLSSKPETAFAVPSGVTHIGDSAFRNAQGLISVTLSEGVTDVDTTAFEWCDALQTVTIAHSVESIGYAAFVNCDAITDVYYEGTYEMRNSTLTIDSTGGCNDSLIDAAWHYQEEVCDFDGTIEWNSSDVEFKGTTPYVVASGSAQTPRFTVKAADGSVVDPGTYTYRYAENTNAGTGYLFVTFNSGYTGTTRAWFKIYLPATTSTFVENIDEGIKVTWKAVEGAAGYVIYRRAWSTTTNGWTAFSRWNNTTDLTYIDGLDESHRVYAGTRYQYGVKAYFAQRTDAVTGALIGGNVGDNFNLGVVGPLKTTVRITTRELTKLVAGNRKITAYWNGSKNFTGYQLSYATDADFTKGVNTIKITSPTTYSKELKSLSNDTTYYVRIRSYHEFEGMTYYGGWSNVLSVKPGSGQTVTPSSTKYRALCVGENAYSGGNALYGCVNDMNSMAGMLRGLKNAFTVTTLPNSSSTEIVNAIRTQFKSATDSDVSLLSFSGHGNTSGIYCVDGRTITFSTLATELNKIKGRVIIILDCCQSGAAIGKGDSFDADAFNRAAIEAFSGYTLEPTDGVRSGELKKSKFIVITAAHSTQYSYDGMFDGSGNYQGAFTAALIKGMGCTFPNGAIGSSSMPADKDNNKKITLKELFDYTYSTAYNWTNSQQAQYYGPDSEVLFFR